MKIKGTICCALMLLLTYWAGGQQVGVGTNNPSERLDVNGNLNIRGQLKLNGQAGLPGQVLQVGGSGLQEWTSALGYKNRSEYFFDGNFTVPTGVHEIGIIAVGGGGGGAKGGGGAGGSLCFVKVKVAPGNSFSFSVATIARGAINENSIGESGKLTQVNGPAGLSISALGGFAGEPNMPGEGRTGVMLGDSIIYKEAQGGRNGEPTTETYMQRLSNEFVTARQYGNGGASLLPPYSVQQGTFFSFNSATLANLTMNYGNSGRQGNDGSGGAGGNMSNGRWGGTGDAGRVIFLW